MTTAQALLRREQWTKDGRAFLLRPAEAGDAASLVALRDSVAAENAFIASLPGDTSVAEEPLNITSLVADGGLGIVAELDGSVCGHCMVRRRSGRFERHIAELAIIVSNTVRGVGIGRSMIATAVDWCRAVRVAKLELSVFPDNTGAIALYRRCGFIDEGMRRGAVRLPQGERDLLLMALDVPG